MSNNDTETGWVGWIFFAGVVMIILGVFQTIEGLVTLFNNDYLVVTSKYLFLVNATTWAWLHIALGVVIFFAGLAVFSGQVWARTVGVILAVLSAIANMGFIPAYPFWSLLMVFVDFMVIYALTVHGGELKENA